jgi:hypothetical protein
VVLNNDGRPAALRVVDQKVHLRVWDTHENTAVKWLIGRRYCRDTVPAIHRDGWAVHGGALEAGWRNSGRATAALHEYHKGAD